MAVASVIFILLLAIVLVQGLSPFPLSIFSRHKDKHGAHTIDRGGRKMSHNKPADLLLFHDNLKVNGNMAPVPTVQSHEVCYPPKNSNHAKFTITAFNVQDLGKKGWAYVKDKTGVGKHKLCLRLKSKRGKGYHFDINIWGYYD